MTYNFYKYSSNGNDFIFIDDRDETFPICNNELTIFIGIFLIGQSTM